MNLRIITLQLFITTFAITVWGQNDWENSTLFEINKEPAHASFVPIATSGPLNFDKTNLSEYFFQTDRC